MKMKPIMVRAHADVTSIFINFVTWFAQVTLREWDPYLFTCFHIRVFIKIRCSNFFTRSAQVICI